MSTKKNTSELKAKLIRLKEIENTIYLAQRSRLGPRQSFALVMGPVAGIAAFFTAISLGAKMGSMALLIGLVVGVLAAVVTYKQSKLPRSYGDRLDGYLAQYEPASLEAFSQLQEQVRRYGSYDVRQLSEWIDIERRAIGYAMEPIMESSQFLKRQL